MLGTVTLKDCEAQAASVEPAETIMTRDPVG